MLMIFLRKPRILNNIDFQNTRSKIQDQKYEAIKWKVVWSWVGTRTFLQKCARTPNSYTTNSSTYTRVKCEQDGGFTRKLRARYARVKFTRTITRT